MSLAAYRSWQSNEHLPGQPRRQIQQLAEGAEDFVRVAGPGDKGFGSSPESLRLLLVRVDLAPDAVRCAVAMLLSRLES